MKKIYRIICVFLSLLLCVSLPTYAESTQISTDVEGIVEALKMCEYTKDELGLSDTDFSELCISSCIKGYTYTSNGCEATVDFIPLTTNGNLKAFAINKNGKYQITTALIEQINNYINTQTEFAIIYDYNSAYLFDGENLIFLVKSSIVSEEREVLTSVNDLDDCDNIELGNLVFSTSLGYVQEVTPRIPIYYACNVSYVSQNPPSNICWAASIACIVNYKKGNNFTAKQVAQSHYGSDYNKGISVGDEAEILQKYGLNYTTRTIFPADGVIFSNIKNDYPVYATVGSYNNDTDHDVVIYAINISSPYLYVMDPEFGSAAASVDDTTNEYIYYSAYANVWLSFKYATCYSWSP